MSSLINPIATCEVGSMFSGNLIVLEATKGMTRAEKPFLTVRLGDKSGDIKTMVWDACESKEIVFKTGAILYITGIITEYNGQKQLKMQRCESPSNDISIEEMLPSAPINGETLYVMVRSKVAKMEDGVLKLITLEILDKYHEKLITHPAAKSVHHNYVGGLLFHTYTMANLAEKIADSYAEADIDIDLLMAGVILHDIGKIEEYTGALATELTVRGKLIGHISIISEEIARIAHRMGDQDNEQVMLLQHLVLSHHGLAQNGWGSTVSPLTIEAHILHTVDKLDAGMDAYKAKAVNTKAGGFTERIMGLDNRSFYKASYKK